jgi:Zn-dependent peptidase ImmA (M78 family)
MRVDVEPAVITWARVRSGMSTEALTKNFGRLPEWESGAASPTLKQLQRFADATHTPFGSLLATSPPVESLPVPDFRTFRDAAVHTASPNLLDTIYACEQRQEWFRGHLQQEQLDGPDFVGSASLSDDPTSVGAAMRRRLSYGVADRAALGSRQQALGLLRDRAELTGVLVMISGIVGSNTHRALDPDEFRGFALVDALAPVVFVNGKDTKAAQIFTLAHELAHVWLGGSALGNSTVASTDVPEVEKWCNAAAAELLVPADSVRRDFDPSADVDDQLTPLARRYRVSTLAVLRRLADTSLITQGIFWRTYERELARVLAIKSDDSGGGDSYKTTPVRVSKRFARAVLESTLEGNTLYRDAFQMLGLKKTSTFTRLVEELGVGMAYHSRANLQARKDAP